MRSQRWPSALAIAGGLALILLIAPAAAGYGERVFNENVAISGSFYPVSSGFGAAQSFLVAQSFILYNVSLYVRNVGGSGNNDPLNVTIQTNAGGFPSGTILAGTSVIGPATTGWLDFPLAAHPTLAGGTVYWIVATNAEPPTRGYEWINSGADVLPGFAEQNLGAGWTVTGVTDLTYVTYGISLEPRIPVGFTTDRFYVSAGGTYAYNVYLNNTGADDARTVRVNLTLPSGVSYVSDTASTIGGTRTGPSNWTFPSLANGPHAFGVTARVEGVASPGSSLTATVHVDCTDPAGVPQPPSTASAAIVVGLEPKSMSFAFDGVRDRTDILTAAPPNGVLDDFDGDGSPGLTFVAGGVATWDLSPAIARPFHLRGPASVVLCLRSLNPTNTATFTVTLNVRGATTTRVASITQAVDLTSGATYPSFTFDLGVIDYWIPRGNVAEIVVTEVSGGTSYLAYNATAYPSAVSVTTDTYVSVDGTAVADGRGQLSPFFSPKDAIAVHANTSDPFGSAEVAGALLTLTDPTGAPLATNASMTAGATDPRTPSSWKAFTYAVPQVSRQGTYAFSIIALEGNGVRAVAVSGTFDVRAPVLDLKASPDATTVAPLGTVRYAVVVGNSGTGLATAWLNASLPAGLTYASDTAGEAGGTRTGDSNWTFTTLGPGNHTFDIVLRVSGNATRGSHLSLRFDLTYRDEKGFLWPGAGVSSELVVEGSPPEAPNLLPFLLLAVLLAALPIAYVLWRRRRGTIEEAFLILQSGLLLCHLSRRMRVAQDKDHDVLGGMLTAIQNFVRDSFRYGENRELNKVEFGDYRILVERGKWVYLAIAISGNEFPGLRKEMKEMVTEIEKKYDLELEKFDGWMEPLLGTRDILARMLRVK